MKLNKNCGISAFCKVLKFKKELLETKVVYFQFEALTEGFHKSADGTYLEGYFLGLKPNIKMLEIVKRMSELRQVYILFQWNEKNRSELWEKQTWLMRNLPFMDIDDFLGQQTHHDRTLIIGKNETAFLVDNDPESINKWSEKGIGITIDKHSRKSSWEIADTLWELTKLKKI